MDESAIDQAYHERNMLVAALSRLYPAHLAIDHEAECGWQTVVCVHIRTRRMIPIQGGMPLDEDSQAAWHIPDRERDLFAHLPMQDNDWDGHTTPEKYHRLRRLIPAKRPHWWQRAG